MEMVSVRELKAHLSAFLKRVESGEMIIVSKRNEPIAELRPIVLRSTAHLFGKPVKGLHVPATFFKPLPDGIVAAFDGE